ncbi:MAG: polyprenyl synthetase family protein [Nitrososphaeraceae archaeon]|nr:polyprenyl synthetase family protein [Nitrososphaeraceae archaeon]MDW0171680.1 polyprenyl synthetase family protein [Nitrososphaeraceae archaeon]MDW0176572.1 polyprenyl synthetase family protein [Nitrososphaeraceae archaeon]MDW0181210.1 polyprenyl synthetase family protein [Nitrososphaeraceae archaeon]MDW0188271.1 polyprenyl synthetase family protein [Nitrososphaeraceae archaeon]
MDRTNIEANPLLEQFSSYLSKINEYLARELDLYSWSEFYTPLRYASEGGKRIRPLILVLSAETILANKHSNTDITEDMFLASCAIELLHTQSVIHDDIIDKEDYRRGKPSFHIKYGYNSSILTADFVLGIILSICTKINNAKVSAELSTAAIKMSEGEMMEIKLTKDPYLKEDDYIKVVEHKTASLFEAASKIGSLLGGGTDEEICAMGSFGHLLGIAYQIHDDIMDWNNEDRLFNILVRNNKQSAEFIDRMEQLFISYSSKAKNELKKINDSVSKKHLEHLTDLTFLQF